MGMLSQLKFHYYYYCDDDDDGQTDIGPFMASHLLHSAPGVLPPCPLSSPVAGLLTPDISSHCPHDAQASWSTAQALPRTPVHRQFPLLLLITSLGGRDHKALSQMRK